MVKVTSVGEFGAAALSNKVLSNSNKRSSHIGQVMMGFVPDPHRILAVV